MGAPTGNFATFNQVGIREDLEDIIYDISPMDTVCVSKFFGRTKVKSTLHE